MSEQENTCTTLSECAAIFEDFLKRNKLVNGAHELALGLALALGDYFGGRAFYVPKGEAYRRALRDKEIYAQFNGANHRELSIKHQLSVGQIYKIIDKQEAERKAERSGKTPVEPQP